MTDKKQQETNDPKSDGMEELDSALKNLSKKQQKTLDAYSGGIAALDSILEGLSEEQLDLAREEGKWGIRQVVHHIVDAENIWATAIKAALGNPGCTFDFGWYILDNKCAEPMDYAHRPIEEALVFWKALRRHVLEMIAHIPGAWECELIVTHPGMPGDQAFTVGKIIGWQKLHLDVHLKQIKETRKAHNL